MTNDKIYFIGNWKMYGNLTSLRNVKNIINLSKSKRYKNAKIIYCPPFTLIDRFTEITKKCNVAVGAQDCFKINGTGPYTGEISAKMLKQIKAQYVILGHSERRNLGDTNKIINKKLIYALEEKLKVILCIGESIKENKKNLTMKVLKNQLSYCLSNVKNLNKILIAYEPIWSIGTGKIPVNKNLEKLVMLLRKYINKKFKNNNVKILYGGSVNPKNINILKKIKNINGFLIGGASQDHKKFIDIVKKTIT